MLDGSRGGGAPVTDFWHWWESDGRRSAERNIADRRLARELNRRVRAMHPGLAWELAKGEHAEHVLVITAEGMPVPRQRAEQWYQQAPVADAVWEYHPARQANRAALSRTLDIAGSKLDLTELAFHLRVDEQRGLLDSSVIHPAFADMAEKTRRQAAVLVLDWALGEDGATRWIRSVETSSACREDSVPAAGLAEITTALADRSAQPRWALLRGKRDGDVIVATVRFPAKWIDRPLLDTHFGVLLPFKDEPHGDLPGPDVLHRLRVWEDQLIARLPPTALLVAHETVRRSRTFHVYGDSDDPVLGGLIRSIASPWPGAAVKSAADPGWRSIRHLTS